MAKIFLFQQYFFIYNESFCLLGKVDMPQSEIMTKYLDTPKTSHSISSPKRTSPSPSSHNYDKKSITETKGKQNKVKLEQGPEVLDRKKYLRIHFYLLKQL